MTEAPVVSVLMAFFRGERYIREAIESVIAQTFTSWEFLLADDAGGDGSASIVDEFAGKHPGRIRRLTHPGGANRGPSASRNLGLAQARGTYVAFIDQDDIWVPTKLAEQVAILAAEPRAAMTFGPSWVWYSWSGNPADRGRDYLQALGFPADTLVAPPWVVCLFLANRTVIPSPSGILVRKSAADAVGGFEDVFRGIYEDKVFYVKLGLKFPIYLSRRCWYWYRRHGESALVVASDRGKYFKLWLEFLAWVGRYMASQNIADEHVERVLAEQVERDSKFRWTVALGRLPGVVGWIKWLLMRAGRRIVSPALQARLAGLWQASYLSPPFGGVGFGDLARARPVSPMDGLERGQTVERALIERFLAKHAHGLGSAVVEWPDHGILADLGRTATGPDLSPREQKEPPRELSSLDAGGLDGLVLPHALQHVYDLKSVLEAARRALKPGGVLLATLPCVSAPARFDMDRPEDYWRFTPDSARRLFTETFGADNVTVEPLGNVLGSVASLHGVGAGELPAGGLPDDPLRAVVIGVRAVKEGSS